ncbi:transcriptional regulator [Allostella vacuolata]|nr:transcriptional regulator [Stella vacuolata]
MTETTGTAEAPDLDEDSAVPAGVGATIRRLRQERGISLQELSRRSGVSTGMLSQVERNRANPSLRILTSIRAALDAPVSALFETAPARPADPPFVRRAGRRPKLDLGYLSKELLSADTPYNLQMMILHLPPGGSSGERPLSYPAEKAGLLLEGQVALQVGDEEVVLQEGDSFIFDSASPHGFRNCGSGQARILWVIGKVALDRHL